MNRETIKKKDNESMDKQCHSRGYVTPVDVLIDLGTLDK